MYPVFPPGTFCLGRRSALSLFARRGQAFDIGDDVADLLVAEAVGAEEGHELPRFFVVGIWVDAGPHGA